MCRTWRVSSPSGRRVPGQGPAARSSSGRGVLDSGTCVSGGREAGLTDVELSGELFNVSDTVPACPTRSVWHAVIPTSSVRWEVRPEGGDDGHGAGADTRFGPKHRHGDTRPWRAASA